MLFIVHHSVQGSGSKKREFLKGAKKKNILLGKGSLICRPGQINIFYRMPNTKKNAVARPTVPQVKAGSWAVGGATCRPLGSPWDHSHLSWSTRGMRGVGEAAMWTQMLPLPTIHITSTTRLGWTGKLLHRVRNYVLHSLTLDL